MRRHRAGDNQIVVIRYPAAIDESAKAVFIQKYGEHPIGPRMPEDATFDDVREVAEDALVKTSYYAHEFYEGLKADLPEALVILQPSEIVLDNARLTTKPLNREVNVAAHVLVELFLYRPPGSLDSSQPCPVDLWQHGDPDRHCENGSYRGACYGRLAAR